MQPRNHFIKALKKEILTHPTIQHYLKTSVGNKNKQGNKVKDVALSQLEKAANSLNEETLPVFLEMLNHTSVKSLLFTGKCWPSITYELATSMIEIGASKTIELVETMLDEEVEKFIEENDDENDNSWKIYFHLTKKWGPEETKKIARLLSSPAIAVLNQNESNIFFVKSFEQLKTFVTDLSHPTAKKFSQLNWIDQSHLFCRPSKLQKFLAFLEKNEETLNRLVNDNLLNPTHIQTLALRLPEEKRLTLLSCHPLKSIVQLTGDPTTLLFASEETLQALMTKLDGLSEKALNFIFKYGIKKLKVPGSSESLLSLNHNLQRYADPITTRDFVSQYTHLQQSQAWKAWALAGSALSIRKAIERNPALAQPIIERMQHCFPSKNIETAKNLSKLFLFSQNAPKKIQDAIDNWIIQSSLEKKVARTKFNDLQSIVKLILDYRIRYMLEKELIEFNHIVSFPQDLTVDKLIAKHIRNILMETKTQLDNPEWKKRGPLGITKPKGIKKLANLLAKPSDHIPFFETIALLQECKKPRGDQKRHPDTQTFYDKTHETLMKWHPDSMQAQKPLTCDEMEIRKKSRVFGQLMRQRELFFTPKDLEETPIAILANELLVQIILSPHDQVDRKKAMDLINDSLSKPRIRK